MVTTKKKKKRVSKKIHTEAALRKYGDKKWEEGHKAGKAQGIAELQRKIQDLLGITLELQCLEVDMERHRYQDHADI